MAGPNYTRRIEKKTDTIKDIREGGVEGKKEKRRLNQAKGQRRRLRNQRQDYRYAKDIARAQAAPTLNAIDRERDQAGADYDDTKAEIAEIFNGLSAGLAPLNANYDKAAQGISSDYQKAIGGIGSSFATGSGSDQEAQALAATMGAGGQTLLDTGRQRNLGYQTSVQRQGQLEEKDTRLDKLDAYNEFIDSLDQQRLDVKGEMGAQIAALMPQFKQQRFDNRMRRSDQDLARDIYKRDGKWRNDEEKDADRSEKEAEEFYRTEAEREGDKPKIKRVNNSISGLKDAIAALEAELANMPHEARAYSSKDEELSAQIDRKKRRLDNKKKKRRRIKRNDNPNY